MGAVRIGVILGKSRIRFIERERITYIESDGHSVLLHCPEDCVALKGPLQRLEEKLGDFGFIRVHRSYLVSIDHIREIDDGWIILDDFKETEIPVGVKYEERLMKAIRTREYIIL